MKTALLALAAAGLVAAATPAAAIVTFESTDFGFATSAPGAATITFDAPPPAGFTLTGGLIQDGSNSLGAAPAIATGVKETTRYLTVNSGDPATIASTIGYRTVSLYWGSIDAYNTLFLLDRDGATIESFTGDQIFPPADGNQSEGSTNRRVTFTSGGDSAPIHGLRFQSTQPAFEVDAIAFTNAVPEPASWAMMIGGLGMAGGSLRARRRRSLALA